MNFNKLISFVASATLIYNFNYIGFASSGGKREQIIDEDFGISDTFINFDQKDKKYNVNNSNHNNELDVDILKKVKELISTKISFYQTLQNL